MHDAVAAGEADATSAVAGADDADCNEPDDDVLMLFRRYESSDKLNGNELKNVLMELGIALESTDDHEIHAFAKDRLGLDAFRQLVDRMRQLHGVADMMTPPGSAAPQHAAASPVLVELELVNGGKTSYA